MTASPSAAPQVDTPRTDALTSRLYNEACAAACDIPEFAGGRETSPEEAYGMAVELAKELERENAALREQCRATENSLWAALNKCAQTEAALLPFTTMDAELYTYPPQTIVRIECSSGELLAARNAIKGEKP